MAEEQIAQEVSQEGAGALPGLGCHQDNEATRVRAMQIGERVLIEKATRTHPDRRDLERFLRGELGRAAATGVVRHLLKGCETCSAVIRPVRGLADRPRTDRLDEEELDG